MRKSLLARLMTVMNQSTTDWQPLYVPGRVGPNSVNKLSQKAKRKRAKWTK